MKVFISQPMNGKTDEEITNERALLEKFAKERYGKDAEIIDSYIKDAPRDKALTCLAKSIEKLSTADAAYFSKDWEKARGCVIEHDCAVAYGIETVECYKY